MTVAAKRSKYFGADEHWYFSGNGTTYENVDADIYFQWVKHQGTVRELMQDAAAARPEAGRAQGC